MGNVFMQSRHFIKVFFKGRNPVEIANLFFSQCVRCFSSNAISLPFESIFNPMDLILSFANLSSEFQGRAGKLQGVFCYKKMRKFQQETKYQKNSIYLNMDVCIQVCTVYNGKSC